MGPAFPSAIGIVGTNFVELFPDLYIPHSTIRQELSTPETDMKRLTLHTVIV